VHPSQARIVKHATFPSWCRSAHLLCCHSHQDSDRDQKEISGERRLVVDLVGQEALIMGKKKKQVASICIILVEN
jgi:hypothetical protein